MPSDSNFGVPADAYKRVRPSIKLIKHPQWLSFYICKVIGSFCFSPPAWHKLCLCYTRLMAAKLTDNKTEFCHSDDWKEEESPNKHQRDTYKQNYKYRKRFLTYVQYDTSAEYYGSWINICIITWIWFKIYKRLESSSWPRGGVGRTEKIVIPQIGLQK